MAKTDRSILANNNQEYGMIADPNKLEASITHAYDKIDQNDDELIAHKSSGDHDGRYYTKTQLDNGQLDNRYYTETELNNGALDGRYYTESELNNGQLDSRYYTKTQLDGGQLDNRYYTETELSGSGGASKVGITPISGLNASNTQQALEGINNKINQAVLGQIPDGSITEQKLAFDPVTQEEFNAHWADNVKHITAAERTAWNSAEANAKAYTDTAPEAMQRNLGRFNKYKSGKDSNGIYTVVEYKRTNGTLYARSVLSGGTSPQYTTRTITYYGTDGTTVIDTVTKNLIYDSDGELINEVVV
jgi:hypothetical protein